MIIRQRSAFRATFVFAFAHLTFVLLGAVLFTMAMHSDTLKAQSGFEALEIESAGGTHKFQVEIADTPSRQSRGLMFRRSLPDNQGMLFEYDSPREISMWMKNTYISLDMVFIRQDGIVHRIESDTEPFSESIISSGAEVTAVLELKAGTTVRLGIKPGDKVLHSFFGTK